MHKRFTISVFFLLSALSGWSQFPRLSMATDAGFQRSFKKEQQYWAIGHTVQLQLHFDPKNAGYLWVAYYSDGKFSNQLTANAKSPLTLPQQVNYRNHSTMRFKHFSLGWKRYLKGNFDEEEKWSLYAYGGFGLMMGRVINTHDPYVDSTVYQLPVRSGKANFKRLTLDLGSGAEFPIGADVYIYGEGRIWVPTTDYPSPHIFVNARAPFVGMINAGIRILF